MNLPSFSKNTHPLHHLTKALLAKAFLVLACLLLPVFAANAQGFLAPLERSGYVKEFIAAFPEGTDYNTASADVFEVAVQKIILAHPVEKAPSVAYAITSAVGLERAKEVAEAIAKLFNEHPALREQVTEIANAMTEALQSRIGAVAEGQDYGNYKEIMPLGDTPAVAEQVSNAISDVLSTFSPFVNNNGPQILPRGVQPGEIQTHETPVVNL